MADTNIPKKNFDQLMAALLQRPKDMLYLLNAGGIYVPKSESLNTVQLQFLKAIKDSAKFRASTADYLSKSVTSGYLSFSGNDEYLNDIGAATGAGTINPNYAAGTTNTITGGNTSSSSSSSGGGFWNTLGQIFTPTTLNKAVNVGLDAYGAKLQSQANNTSEQNALAAEQLRLQQIQAEQQLEAQKQQGGLPGWAWVLIIGVPVLTIVGVIIYKRRKRRAA